jgi:MHS family alpha-ketoglutarate permease-like MFS transporter
VLRRTLVETTSTESRRHESAGSLRGLWQHRRALFIVLGFTAGGSLIFYTFTTYMQKYLVNTSGMNAASASMVMTAALFMFMLMQPAFGALSDRIGRRLSMILFGLFTLLTTIPILNALGRVETPFQAFWLVLAALAGVSFYTSISGIVKAELFPMEVRALGVGLPYAIANAAFGGTAEYVALWFKSSGQEAMFFWYVTAFAALVLIVSLQMPDARRLGYLKEPEDPEPGEPEVAFAEGS